MKELFGNKLEEGDLVIVKPSMGYSGLMLGEVTKNGTVMLGSRVSSYSECFLIENPSEKILEEAKKNREIYQQHQDYLKQKKTDRKENRIKKEDAKLFTKYDGRGFYIGSVKFQDKQYDNAFISVQKYECFGTKKATVFKRPKPKNSDMDFISFYKSFPLIQKESINTSNKVSKEEIFQAIQRLLCKEYRDQKNCFTFLDTGEWVTGASYKIKKDD